MQKSQRHHLVFDTLVVLLCGKSSEVDVPWPDPDVEKHGIFLAVSNLAKTGGVEF